VSVDFVGADGGGVLHSLAAVVVGVEIEIENYKLLEVVTKVKD